MVKLPVAIPLKKTESFLTYTPARRPQMWRATLEVFITILIVLFNGFLSRLLHFWGMGGGVGEVGLVTKDFHIPLS